MASTLLVVVVTMSRSPTSNGRDCMLVTGRVGLGWPPGNSPVWKVQATCRRPTLAGVMSARSEKRIDAFGGAAARGAISETAKTRTPAPTPTPVAQVFKPVLRRRVGAV